MRGQRAEVGDERCAPNGYWYINTADHGWRLKHHIAMEEILGRKLKPNERVVFVNKKDKTDYSPRNLMVQEKGRGSNRRRIAQLEARKAEIQAQIDELKAIDGIP